MLWHHFPNIMVHTKFPNYISLPQFSHLQGFLLIHNAEFETLSEWQIWLPTTCI